MSTMNAIVVVDFLRKSDRAFTKVWKRLAGFSLEQRLTLPLVLLVAGNLLELTLDGVTREMRIEHLRWEHARQTLYVHVMLTPAEAGALRELGFKAWRPWVQRQIVAQFLERCRASGWTQRGAVSVKPPPAPVESKRIEPTL